jgi:hypothetical protein
MKPLAIDLFCGLGGWTEALLAEGFDVVGFDIERHHYGDHRYPAQLVLQDVLTLHGSQFRDAALIVASPPCQAYSYRAMPWKRARALPPPDNSLFEACFRIQREASEAAGRHVPLIVENVRGAQKWVGRARWNFGSFYLWGDVPALMPVTMRREATKAPGCAANVPGIGWTGFANEGWRDHHATKNAGGSWFAIAHNTTSGKGQNPDGRKVGGIDFNGYGTPGYKAQAFNTTAQKRIGGTRKFASAMIAKIPAPLARHIARTFKAIQQEWERP